MSLTLVQSKELIRPPLSTVGCLSIICLARSIFADVLLSPLTQLVRRYLSRASLYIYWVIFSSYVIILPWVQWFFFVHSFSARMWITFSILIRIELKYFWSLWVPCIYQSFTSALNWILFPRLPDCEFYNPSSNVLSCWPSFLLLCSIGRMSLMLHVELKLFLLVCVYSLYVVWGLQTVTF